MCHPGQGPASCIGEVRPQSLLGAGSAQRGAGTRGARQAPRQRLPCLCPTRCPQSQPHLGNADLKFKKKKRKKIFPVSQLSSSEPGIYSLSHIVFKKMNQGHGATPFRAATLDPWSITSTFWLYLCETRWWGRDGPGHAAPQGDLILLGEGEQSGSRIGILPFCSSVHGVRKCQY